MIVCTCGAAAVERIDGEPRIVEFACGWSGVLAAEAAEWRLEPPRNVSVQSLDAHGYPPNSCVPCDACLAPIVLDAPRLEWLRANPDMPRARVVWLCDRCLGPAAPVAEPELSEAQKLHRTAMAAVEAQEWSKAAQYLIASAVADADRVPSAPFSPELRDALLVYDARAEEVLSSLYIIGGAWEVELEH